MPRKAVPAVRGAFGLGSSLSVAARCSSSESGLGGAAAWCRRSDCRILLASEVMRIPGSMSRRRCTRSDRASNKQARSNNRPSSTVSGSNSGSMAARSAAARSRSAALPLGLPEVPFGNERRFSLPPRRGLSSGTAVATMSIARIPGSISARKHGYADGHYARHADSASNVNARRRKVGPCTRPRARRQRRGGRRSGARFFGGWSRPAGGT